MNVSEAFKSISMKSMLGDHLLRNGLLRIPYHQTRKMPMELLPPPNSSHIRTSLTFQQGRTGSVLSTISKLVKDKLGLGAQILQVGGVEKLFRQIFTVREGEQLLKASRCRLFTTAGPIQGRLFISTDRLAFCSDRPIAKYYSPAGELLRFHYKIMIPLNKIKRASESKNVGKPSQKYLQVTTTDDFEFWFMGFLNYKRTLRCLQEAVFKSLI
uniref:GRAM domain-containing protein n=1 Tax=Opuntia streptacantha TaxID=393608 RepID=A0A7C8YK13_OPUST